LVHTADHLMQLVPSHAAYQQRRFDLNPGVGFSPTSQSDIHLLLYVLPPETIIITHTHCISDVLVNHNDNKNPSLTKIKQRSLTLTKTRMKTV